MCLGDWSRKDLVSTEDIKEVLHNQKGKRKQVEDIDNGVNYDADIETKN
jgi:hypothetical protein